MKSLVIVSMFLFSLGAHAFGGSRVAVDPVTASTLVDGDATGLAEGCGQQPSPLGMFCREVEGDAAAKSIFFIGPPAQCDREACVFVKIYNNQGQLVAGPSIPKGQTRVEVPWRKLLGCSDDPKVSCVFHQGDRGFWTFNSTVFWKDPDGRERQSTSQGDIVLRVFKTSYTPLHAVEADPAYVWTWTEGNFVYKVTSGLRAYVGRVR